MTGSYKFLIGLVVLILVVVGALVLFRGPVLVSPYLPEVKRSLEPYAFYNLQKRVVQGSDLKLEKAVRIQSGFTTYAFSYNSEGKKITGLANIPVGNKKYPVVVMLRGYVDEEIYQPGVGTQRTAEFFAKNGFITLAPDFLGYGGSDKAYPDALMTRFDAPLEVLNLIAAVPSLPTAEPKKIGLWGHSNGGQIALSVLEITGRRYPTVLWAPVSKPFPESVLRFASEMEDKGEYLRKIIGDFGKFYDPRHFSIIDYLAWISAPLQIHQGSSDEEVPREWSDELVKKLRVLGKSVNYYTYPGENHNFNRGSWPLVVSRDLDFYRKALGL